MRGALPGTALWQWPTEAGRLAERFDYQNKMLSSRCT
jgi:hypothetical protein